MAAGTASLCFTLIFVGVFVFVSAEKHPVMADPGQDVTLTCQTQDNKNKKITVVEWSRADLQPEYVLVYRDGHFVPANQHPSFKNRVDLKDRQMKDGDVSVILKAVTTADEGTYECAVFMEGARTWNHTIIYLIVAPPEQKTITADPGQDVTLTCRAPNKKIRDVEWRKADLGKGYVLVYRDGHFVPGYQHPSFKNRVDLQDRQMKDGDMSVILKDVTDDDDGTYKCAAHMRQTTRRKRAADPITIIYLIVVPPEKKYVTVESGEDVTLTCRVPNNNIRPVEWIRADLQSEYVLLHQGGQFDPANQDPSFKNRVDLQDRQMKDGDVSVILKAVTTADEGRYECHVFLTKTQSWELISIINLIVVPPEQKELTAKTGEDVTLRCRAPNTSKIRDVKWITDDLVPKYLFLYQDGHLVPDNQHPSFKNRVDLQDRQMKDGDVSVILKAVTVNDTGTYECHVLMDGTNHRKRIADPISSIYLRVLPPGQP